jgi:hypothetical protein
VTWPDGHETKGIDHHIGIGHLTYGMADGAVAEIRQNQRLRRKSTNLNALDVGAALV